jgi:CRP-like cAMP-binding protein
VLYGSGLRDYINSFWELVYSQRVFKRKSKDNFKNILSNKPKIAMQPFVSLCTKLSPLTDSALSDLENVLEEKAFKKGDYILRHHQQCRNLYFINSGLVKMFCYTDGKEFIMNFFKEGGMFTVLDSFPMQLPSEYNIIALENTTVQYLSHGDLEQLSQKHHCIESFYRKLLLRAAHDMMQRIKEMLVQSHTEHYNQYLENNRELIQRLSLGDLACYLGITQVSLSRIRAKK